ncbi:MAG: hypothetical protein IPF72_19780 [Chitinophagaceae bacterium]|nr:hypothetical protein [Chitinophagaceae bacterium]
MVWITRVAQDTLELKYFLGIPFKHSLETQLIYLRDSQKFNDIVSRKFPQKTIYRTSLINSKEINSRIDSVIVGIIISNDSSIVERKSYGTFRLFVQYYYTNAIIKNLEFENVRRYFERRYIVFGQFEYGDESSPIEERYSGYQYYFNKRERNPYVGVFRSSNEKVNNIMVEFSRLDNE